MVLNTNRRPQSDSGHRHPKTAATFTADINPLQRWRNDSPIPTSDFLAGIRRIPREADLLLSSSSFTAPLLLLLHGVVRRDQIEHEAAVGALHLKIRVARRSLLRDNQAAVARSVFPHHQILSTMDRRRELRRRRADPHAAAAEPRCATVRGGDGRHVGREIGAALDAEVVTEFLTMHGDRSID